MEAAFIPKELYTATLPFTAVSADFRTAKDLNAELYPKQIPNLNLMLSSASDISSEMYAHYREAFKQMMLGNTSYFVADLDYHQSIAPYLNGKPMHPLVTIEEVERMYATQPYKAEREFGNKWSGDQGEDVLVKRQTLERYSKPMYPEFSNTGGKKYIVCYDPSSRQDNSVILVAELFRDEEKGLMLKLVNMQNLVEKLKGGQIGIIQKPEQVEILKNIILDYNMGYQDYDGIDWISIDGGSGGGGFEIAQYLLADFKGKDNKMHRGIIDLENEYMEMRADDYPGAAQILSIFNFKRDKTAAYEATASAINQGLVVFPKDLNIRNEIEFEQENPDGSLVMRYEKPSLDEMNVLIQINLAKEELMGIQRSKRPNGTVVFEATPEAKSNNLHDDRADCIAMACYRLMQLRANEALDIEHASSDFSKVFHSKSKKINKSRNPFYDKKRGNPFHTDTNPFA